MFEVFTRSSTKALVLLGILTFLYFLENFDRYLIAVSPIPYIDYSSYEYSILAGPAFAVVYTIGGLFFALGYSDYLQQNRSRGSRMSKFAVLSFSTFIFSFAFGATALAVNFWQQAIIRIVMGLAQSIITPFSTSLIRDYFSSESLGSAFGIFNTGTYFAFALSLSLGIFIYTNYGWQAGYLLFGIIGIGGSMLLPCLSFCQLEHDFTKFDDHEIVDIQGTIRPSDELSSFFLYDNNRTLSHTIPIGTSTATASTSGPSSSLVPPSPKTRSSYPQFNPIYSVVPNDLSTHDPVIIQNETNFINDAEGLSHSNHSFSQPIVTKTLATSTSLFVRMKDSIWEIAMVYWWNNRGIYLLCLATAIRLGGGYIWSAYTGVFFGDLFLKETDSIDCQYSYNADYTASSYDRNIVCDSDYPYCVSGDCNALNQYPWHNEGMNPEKIESYMSWVPIVGSALGSVLGGLISDKIVKWSDSISTSTIIATETTGLKRYPIRAFICGISTLISLPLVIYSFFLDYPGCFLIYIASGLVGEVYLSQSLAIIADPLIIPPRLVTTSVALFMLIITLIGGNSPLLIPAVQSTLSYDDVTVSFNAQSRYNTTSVPTTETFDVLNNNADLLLYSCLYSLIGCYALSGILFLLSYLVMTRTKS